jgi:glycosyltransferase involved in cell wall biosynthesis
MDDPVLSILQVNSVDAGGGAARVAGDLFETYRKKGHDAWLIVGNKRTQAPFIQELVHDPYRSGFVGMVARLWKPLAGPERRMPWLRTLHRRMLLAVDIRRIKNRWMGIEDFEFPGSAHLFDMIPKKPQIVHFHNLHGDYFDLRELSMFSQKVPVILTLHDGWLLSGHCAYSIDCERWKTGCGACPDLTLPPPVHRDATASNWLRKQEIFQGSRVRISTPSRWLMQKVEKSMLMPAAIETRIIPNGVDLSVFRPADKISARKIIDLPNDARVILAVGNNLRSNSIKDYLVLRSAFGKVLSDMPGQKVIIIIVGEDAPDEKIGEAEVRFVPYQNDPRAVAAYYQAADVFVHAAREEVWGLTITEALACGTPVVASAVGGIPEQIVDGETGFLASPGDSQAFATRMEQILNDPGLQQRMSLAAVDSARQHFDRARMADDYLRWYEEILIP